MKSLTPDERVVLATALEHEAARLAEWAGSVKSPAMREFLVGRALLADELAARTRCCDGVLLDGDTAMIVRLDDALQPQPLF